MNGYNLYMQSCLLSEQGSIVPSWHYYTYDGQVAAANGDCVVLSILSVWTMYLSVGNICVGCNTTFGLSKIGSGLRFLNVVIPQGATITAAYIQVSARSSQSAATVNSKIIGSLDSNPAVWSTIADYQARRGTSVGGANNSRRTTAEVAWAAIAAWTVGTWYTSPSIVSVIQELINQAAFVSGNALALFWDDHDGLGSSGVTYREGEGYVAVPAEAAKLHIEASKYF